MCFCAVKSEQMPTSKRILIIPAAGLLILAACIWRISNPRQNQADTQLPAERRPAPSFQLYDQNSTLVKLEAFLHRHTIVLVFFDGSAGPEQNRTLVELRKFQPALKSEGIVVFGISTALPQENRNNSAEPFPFPLLTDAVAADSNSVHRQWGTLIPAKSLDKPSGTTPAVFVIDREGLVNWQDDSPQEDSSPETLISRLLS